MGNFDDKIHVVDDYPFHHEIRTRWKDMDSFGHVNNANYVTYIEDARITLFKRWRSGTGRFMSSVLRMRIGSGGSGLPARIGTGSECR